MINTLARQGRDANKHDKYKDVARREGGLKEDVGTEFITGGVVMIKGGVESGLKVLLIVDNHLEP